MQLKQHNTAKVSYQQQSTKVSTTSTKNPKRGYLVGPCYCARYTNRPTYDYLYFEEQENFSKRAQTTGPKTLKFASLLGQEEGPLAQQLQC